MEGRSLGPGGRGVRGAIGVLLLAGLGWGLAGHALGTGVGSLIVVGVLGFFGISFVLQALLATPG